MRILSSSVVASAAAVLLALSTGETLRATGWAASGLGGGGTQNCLTVDPSNSSIVICASDISGIQRTTDGGKSWAGSNLGMPAGSAQKVACVAWDDDGSSTAYAGTDAGFFASTDGGGTWAELSSSPQFSGNGTSLRWPRDTGNLIVADQATSSKYLYAGSYNNGVQRSTDGGNTWTTIGLSSYEITGIAWDSAHPSHLFVTTRGNNVWWTSTARSLASGTGTTGWTQLTGAPAYPEEALVLGSTLFVAGATTDSGGYTSGGGIWSTSATSPGTFTQLGTSGSFTIPTDTTYTGLAGSGSGSTATIYLGAANPTSNDTVLRSTNGGSTWAPITLSANVAYTVYDSGGNQYWEEKTNGPSYYLLGADSCGISNIQIDPNNSSKVMVAAQSGFWGTTNATATSTSVLWYPYVGGYGTSGGGLSVTEGTTVTIDPNKPGRAYYGCADFSFLYSLDGGQTWQAGQSTGGGGTMGRGIWVDPVASTVYLGKKADNGATTPSDVFSSADPSVDAWTDLNMPLNANDEEYGIGGARDSSGNVYIFACVAGPDAGLYRYNPNGSPKWSVVSSAITPDTGSNPLITFGWTPGDSNVFVYEQGTGLWRGSSYGTSWTNVWSTTSTALGTGFLVADPATPGTLYISTSSGVYRFTGADSGSSLTPTALNTPVSFSPGALALSNGVLYCCGLSNGTVNGSCIAYPAPANSASYSTISDTVNYPGQSYSPSDLAVDGAGNILIAERDEGLMFGQPLFQDNFSGGTGNWTLDTGTWATGGSGPYYFEQSASAGGIANVSVGGSSSWTDYSVNVDATPLTFGSGTGSLSISLYWQDTNDRYISVVDNTGTGTIKEDSGGTQTSLASGSITGGFSANTTYAVRFSVNSSGVLTLYVNGAQVAQATNTVLTQAGSIGLSTYNATGKFANVSVTQP